jgi:hypothetical protein
MGTIFRPHHPLQTARIDHHSQVEQLTVMSQTYARMLKWPNLGYAIIPWTATPGLTAILRGDGSVDRELPSLRCNLLEANFGK